MMLAAPLVIQKRKYEGLTFWASVTMTGLAFVWIGLLPTVPHTVIVAH
jgi:hypothetical protein